MIEPNTPLPPAAEASRTNRSRSGLWLLILVTIGLAGLALLQALP